MMTFGVTVNLVLLDALTKEAAIKHLPRSASGYGSPVEIIPNLFDLCYVENRGAAWGMFQGRVSWLAIFAVFAFAAIVWKRKSLFPRNFIGRIAEVLLYAGIIGNFLDRIFRSAVIDFFDFHWWSHHFPCFNVADVYITVAAGLLLIFSFVYGDREKDDKKASPEK